MERRKFVIGLGALATGSAAAVGSGAFSAARIDDRDANFKVTGDEDSLVALIPGNQFSETESESTLSEANGYVDYDDGELDIHLEGEEGQGMNTGSVYQLGAIGSNGKDAMDTGLDNGLSTDDVVYGEEEDQWLDSADVKDDPAFVIANNTEDEINVQLSLRNASLPNDVQGAFVLVGDKVDFEQGAAAFARGFDDQPTGETTAGVDSGSYAGVSLILKAENGADVGDISGDLEVRVEGAIRQD